MDKAQFDVAIKTRTYVRQRITRICNQVDNNFDNLEEVTKKLYIGRLDSLYAEIKPIDKSLVDYLISIKSEDSAVSKEYEHIESYEDRIILTLNKLKTEVPQAIQLNSAQPNIQSQRLKLPDVPLPTFSNLDKESLEKFFHNFESIIDKHNLTSFEKFVYLKNQLRGSPSSLIESLDINSRNYETAKQLLSDAFASKLTQQYAAIKRLTGLKLSLGSDPYNFIGDMRTIISSFRSLEISIDVVLTYFIWFGMNDSFQSHLIHMTNCNKPNLNQIESNMFDATERYLRSIDKNCKYNSKPSGDSRDSSTKVFAANVKPKTRYRTCNLCLYDGKEASHEMFKCPCYVTPYKKVEKLKAIRGCSKCSFNNHESRNCTFKFHSKCRECNGDHMSFLCLRTKVDEKSKVNSMISLVQAFPGGSSGSIMLPTFTCDIVGGNNDLEHVRVMKDGGCQKNFILDRVSRDLSLRVVDRKTEITIQGINSQRTLITNTVKVPMIIAGKIEEILAICLPSINLSFAVTGISELVDEFTKKGYAIADHEIEKSKPDIIDNISIILGTESDYLLPLRYVKFGREDNPSSFIISPLGVIFSGDTEIMLENVRYLDSHETPRNSNGDKFTSFSGINLGRSKSSMNVDELTIDKFDSMTEIDLNVQCDAFLDYDLKEDNESLDSQDNISTIDYLLTNVDRDDSGRIRMPLPWNTSVSEHLAQNFTMAKNILNSNLKKLDSINGGLRMYDDVIAEQESLGIIEKIDDVKSYINSNPDCSFLAHMGVFKFNRDTTKLRIVYLSNLKESLNGESSVSHNQAIKSGPNLNHKISTALSFLRFDRYLLTFDIKRAFLNIVLREEDQRRLLFLWFRNVESSDFSLVAYKNLRLTFGLRASPCMLMLALFKILILDIEEDSVEVIELKKQVFHTIYMDNGGFSCHDRNKMEWAYETLQDLFAPYRFELQQFHTNLVDLNDEICDSSMTEEKETKLLGTKWNKVSDTIYPNPINLDPNANTRRKVLKTLHSVYDILNIYAPMLNRAKLFLQKVQLNANLGWDKIISKELQREWSKICKQVNGCPPIEIPRQCGAREDAYSLFAFTDASKELYGVVIYIKNLSTGLVSYFISKVKVVNSSKLKKTIPALEFQAITLGVEMLIDIYLELTGENTVIPIAVRDLSLFTDSMVAIHWLQNFSVKLDKMQRVSTFVMNRMYKISGLCDIKPITFNFIDGINNPADHITRCISYKKLVKTSFHVGPEFLGKTDACTDSDLKVLMPNPNYGQRDEVVCNSVQTIEHKDKPSFERFSTFTRLINVYKLVFRFVKRMKLAISDTHPRMKIDENTGVTAMNYVFRTDQEIHFSEVINYLSDRKGVTEVPKIVNRLNIQTDKDGLLRVKCKIKDSNNLPMLLSKDSYLTLLLIRHTHERLGHGGVYVVLKELRPQFYLLSHFSTVKRVLRDCVICKRYNQRRIKLNVNEYRKFRIEPDERPFGTIYLDYMGPFEVRKTGEVCKIWILVVSCLWSRAVNLKICLSADVKDFLRSLQLHIYEYGNFRMCRSDLGSQLSAGYRLIREFLKDEDTKTYLEENGIKEVHIDQFCKGNSALGSLVENAVKQTKLIINKSVRKNILTLSEFELLIAQVIHLVNRRPIAFKEALRGDNLPDPITPEIIIRGYELPVVTIIPELQGESDYADPDFEISPVTIRKISTKFEKVRNRVLKIYREQFLCNLIAQATDKRDRYKRVDSNVLSPGDIVLLVEDFTKRSNYRMGLVLAVETNELRETTSATIRMGRTREIVNRHSTSLILLLSYCGEMPVAKENEISSPLRRSDRIAKKFS